MIEADLADQLKKGVKLSYQKYEGLLADSDVIWEVTMRSGRKHKKYPREASKMKGIENNSNGILSLICRMLHYLNDARFASNLLARRHAPEVQVSY